MKARKIAEFLQAEILGDPTKDVGKPGYLHTAKQDELAYCYLKNDEKDLDAIKQTKAGIVICQEHLKEQLEKIRVNPTIILSKAAKYDFARVLQEYFVDETPAISPFAFIGSNTEIGKNVDIHPNAVVYDKTIIGDNVTIRSNAVLGAEGLDYGRNLSGDLKRIPHLSQLIIEDNVDIGCNTTIQKGMLRPTVIREGTKIGPNCDIGHEVTIGRFCIITGMTLIAGAAEIRDYVFIAPHSTIKNGVKLGKNVFVGIGSLVINDIPDGMTVLGRPAIEIDKFRAQRRQLKTLIGEDQ